MTEDERYKAVQAQITHLLDKAADERDDNGMVGLGCVWLAAQMYERNENAHTRASQEKRTDG